MEFKFRLFEYQTKNEINVIVMTKILGVARQVKAVILTRFFQKTYLQNLLFDRCPRHRFGLTGSTCGAQKDKKARNCRFIRQSVKIAKKGFDKLRPAR